MKNKLVKIIHVIADESFQKIETELLKKSSKKKREGEDDDDDDSEDQKVNAL